MTTRGLYKKFKTDKLECEDIFRESFKDDFNKICNNYNFNLISNLDSGVNWSSLFLF